jgi:UDP-N-acetylglucosamine 2-epimerase (non-hydrolysing)
MEVMIVLGTRPEGIKLAPVIRKLAQHRRLRPVVVSTGQHREMLSQTLHWFDIVPDHDLAVMRDNQTLNSALASIIDRIDPILDRREPRAVLVQGDTTTAFAAAVAAFHRQIPVGHVEAGLRTYDLAAPYPEEGNRAMISRIARWHFTPTLTAARALEREKVAGRILLTGNTVIDARAHHWPSTREFRVGVRSRLRRNRRASVPASRCRLRLSSPSEPQRPGPCVRQTVRPP